MKTDILDVIVKLDDMIREADDEYFEEWLMYGPPDGSTRFDIAQMIADDPKLANEWVELGTDLLKLRDEEEAY